MNNTLEVYDAIFSPEVLFVLTFCLLTLITNIIFQIASSQVSRVGIIFMGTILIGVAGLGFMQFSSLAQLADLLHQQKQLSDETYTSFTRVKDVFIYLFPFVSAALGTNLISDAITKPQRYEKDFSILELTKNIIIAAYSTAAFIVGIISIPFILAFIMVRCTFRLINRLAKLAKKPLTHLALRRKVKNEG